MVAICIFHKELEEKKQDKRRKSSVFYTKNSAKIREKGKRMALVSVFDVFIEVTFIIL